MTRTFVRAAMLAVAASAALAACGGGDSAVVSTTPTPPAPGNTADAPPASASASTAGFLAFIAAFGSQNFDQSEPYDLSAFTGPTDNVDTSEPVATSADAAAS